MYAAVTGCTRCLNLQAWTRKLACVEEPPRREVLEKWERHPCRGRFHVSSLSPFRAGCLLMTTESLPWGKQQLEPGSCEACTSDTCHLALISHTQSKDPYTVSFSGQFCLKIDGFHWFQNSFMNHLIYLLTSFGLISVWRQFSKKDTFGARDSRRAQTPPRPWRGTWSGPGRGGSARTAIRWTWGTCGSPPLGILGVVPWISISSSCHIKACRGFQPLKKSSVFPFVRRQRTLPRFSTTVCPLIPPFDLLVDRSHSAFLRRWPPMPWSTREAGPAFDLRRVLRYRSYGRPGQKQCWAPFLKTHTDNSAVFRLVVVEILACTMTWLT